MPLKLKVFIQTLHRTKERDKISFFMLIIKTPKKSTCHIAPPPSPYYDS